MTGPSTGDLPDRRAPYHARMSTIGQFSNQPEIEVTFVIDRGDPPTELRVLVHRGQTGVVAEQVRLRSGLTPGSRIRCIVERWNGDKPATRVEDVPLE